MNCQSSITGMKALLNKRVSLTYRRSNVLADECVNQRALARAGPAKRRDNQWRFQPDAERLDTIQQPPHEGPGTAHRLPGRSRLRPAAEPLTVASALSRQDGSTATVRGYVVGQPTASSTVVTSGFPNDYALALADAPGQTATSQN